MFRKGSRASRNAAQLREERQIATSEILRITDQLPTTEQVEALLPRRNALATPQVRTRRLRRALKRQDWLRRWRHVTLLALAPLALVASLLNVAPAYLEPYAHGPGPLVAVVLGFMYLTALRAATRTIRAGKSDK